MRRSARAVVVAAAAGVVALAAGCSLFGERFDPWGARAAAARRSAVLAVERVLDIVVAKSAEHGRLRADACHEGQDNWKCRDEYAWDCRVAAAAVIDGAETRQGVPQALTDLHRRLVSAGCGPRQRLGLLEVVREYWLPLRDRPGYGPASLPSGHYTCPGGIEVEVVSSSPGATDVDRTAADAFGIGFAGDTRISAEPLSPAALDAARSSLADQLFVVRVTKRYYAIRR